MKFSVALESTSAIALALLAMEWTKNRSVIDFHVDRYTSPLLLCLISADLIRQWENPHLSPSLSPGHSTPDPSYYSTAASLRPPHLWGWVGHLAHFGHRIQGSLWFPVVVFLGSFERSDPFDHTRNMLLVDPL